MRRRAVGAAALLVSATMAGHAGAFQHIVKPGETLAQVAERVYGDARRETVLVGANALDVQGGTVIAAGMRLEVPAPGHHTVIQGESWADLALSWLGTNDMARTELLAHANKGVPWVPPVEGQEIEIPAVVTYLAGEGETVNSLAARFWGDANRGWELNSYNHRDGALVRRGEVMLIAMPGLRLTEAGSSAGRRRADSPSARHHRSRPPRGLRGARCPRLRRRGLRRLEVQRAEPGARSGPRLTEDTRRMRRAVT
jgi:hypothetical protein